MKKFTPGPWRWEEVCSSENPSKTVAMQLITMSGVPHNDKTVLSVREDWIRPFKDVEHANAHLIAAAPEMYEAASAIAELPVSPDGQFLTGRDSLPRLIRNLRAALKKARGDQ